MLPDDMRDIARECQRLKKGNGERVEEEDYVKEGVALTDRITEQEFDAYWDGKGWRKRGGK